MALLQQNTKGKIMSSDTQKNAMAILKDKGAPISMRLKSVREVMEANKEQMFQALPAHVTADRLIRVSLNCIRATPKLLDCTPASLFGAITESATLGLECNGVLGHAYLIPYGKECVLVPGYKGLIDLVRRSGNVSTLSMEVVHQGDNFSYQLGDQPMIHHIPNDDDPERDDKPITHAYAVVVLRDGGIQRKVWTTAKIDKHKERYSKAWKKADSPWRTAWPVMAKKTVIRDMINRGEIPTSVEVMTLAARDEYTEAIDVKPTSVVTTDTVRTVDDLTLQLEAEEAQTQPVADEPEPTEDNRDSWRLPMFKQIDDAKTLTEVDAVAAQFTASAIDDSERNTVDLNAAARKQKIREARGDGSNDQGSLLD